MLRPLAVAFILSGSALQAQQHPLVGAWQVSYPAGMRMENGAATTIMATGSLNVEAKGDSLIASLATDASPDLPTRPPARLIAKAGAGDAVFVSHTKATVNINGEESQVTSISTWKLAARGDSLTGTVERTLEGHPGAAQRPAPVTGKRRRT